MDTANSKGACAVNGCDRPTRAGGLCTMHYQRFRTHGSTDKPERKKVPIPHGTIQGYNFHRCRCEQCVAARRSYADGWRNAHLDQLHHEYLLRTYGITQEQYDEILERQGGVCALCRQVRLDRRRKHLDVDHDHETGMIRGILCNPCNRLVGRVEARLQDWRPVLDYLKAVR